MAGKELEGAIAQRAKWNLIVSGLDLGRIERARLVPEDLGHDIVQRVEEAEPIINDQIAKSPKIA